MTVIDEIAAERKRQIEVEGWTSGHDDSWDSGHLAAAASCYALNASRITYKSYGREPENWPFHYSWWKPKDRRRDLIRAGALVVAEIERLDRTAKEPTND